MCLPRSRTAKALNGAGGLRMSTHCVSWYRELINSCKKFWELAICQTLKEKLGQLFCSTCVRGKNMSHIQRALTELCCIMIDMVLLGTVSDGLTTTVCSDQTLQHYFNLPAALPAWHGVNPSRKMLCLPERRLLCWGHKLERQNLFSGLEIHYDSDPKSIKRRATFLLLPSCVTGGQRETSDLTLAWIWVTERKNFYTTTLKYKPQQKSHLNVKSLNFFCMSDSRTDNRSKSETKQQTVKQQAASYFMTHICELVLA